MSSVFLMTNAAGQSFKTDTRVRSVSIGAGTTIEWVLAARLALASCRRGMPTMDGLIRPRNEELEQLE